MPTRTLGPGSLTIGQTASAREWGGNVTKCELIPDTSADDDVPMLDGSTLSGEETTKYTLGGSIQQDYDFDSLEAFCFANNGTELSFVWIPNNDGGISWSGTVKIRPVKIGGDVKKRNSTDFEFPLVGNPTPAENV